MEILRTDISYGQPNEAGKWFKDKVKKFSDVSGYIYSVARFLIYHFWIYKIVGRQKIMCVGYIN